MDNIRGKKRTWLNKKFEKFKGSEIQRIDTKIILRQEEEKLFHCKEREKDQNLPKYG